MSPTSPACVPQDHLEPVLLDHLRSLPSRASPLGTEVVGVRERRTGVEVVLRDVPGRGAHRRGPLPGRGRRGAQRGARGAGDPDARARPPGRGVTACSGRRCGTWSASTATASTSRKPGRSRARSCPPAAATAGCTARWDAGRPCDATPRRGSRAGSRWAGVPRPRAAIERIGAFTFAAQLADRFRRDSAFLVGDAAHRVTPRGGTGMNTAIHDGYDLGWKLAWVLRGWAGPDAARHLRGRAPAGRRAQRRALRRSRRLPRETADELRVDLGGRIPHLWVPRRGPRLHARPARPRAHALHRAGLARRARPTRPSRRRSPSTPST